MLDAWTFKRLILDHTGFIYSICHRVGFRGEELRDAVHEVWTALWADRASWPDGGPKSELAWLRTNAYRTAVDYKRRVDGTDKRGKKFQIVSLTRADNSDPANGRDCAALRVFVDYDGTFDRALIDHAIRVVASTLSMESEAIILSRLDGGPSFGKYETQRAFRNFRRAADLPINAPQTAGVGDAATHLIRTAQRIEHDAALHLDDIDITQEISCDTDLTPMNSHASAATPMSVARSPRASAPSPTPVRSTSASVRAIPTSSNVAAKTPSSKSPRQPSASEPSPRPASSASNSTAATATPASRRLILPNDHTTLTPRSWPMDEDSSVSGSPA